MSSNTLIIKNNKDFYQVQATILDKLFSLINDIKTLLKNGDKCDFLGILLDLSILKIHITRQITLKDDYTLIFGKLKKWTVNINKILNENSSIDITLAIQKKVLLNTTYKYKNIINNLNKEKEELIFSLNVASISLKLSIKCIYNNNFEMYSSYMNFINIMNKKSCPSNNNIINIESALKVFLDSLSKILFNKSDRTAINLIKREKRKNCMIKIFIETNIINTDHSNVKKFATLSKLICTNQNTCNILKLYRFLDYLPKQKEINDHIKNTPFEEKYKDFTFELKDMLRDNKKESMEKIKEFITDMEIIKVLV